MTKSAQTARAELELTILMPCLNEAETLAVCIRKAQGFLQRARIKGEVLIADNGSTDGSRDIAAKAGASIVDIPQKGYGAALAGGISAAKGRFVIMADADDSYDFANLDAFVERLRAGDKLVMGNRFLGGIAKGAMPVLHRYLGNPVLSFFGRLFFRTRIGDFHCGLRGFDREAIEALNLRTSGMEFASEMVVKATMAGLPIAEVPTTLSPDGRSRAPHLRSFRDGWRHLRFLLLFSPRWLFLYPGAILLFIGLLIAALLSGGPLHISPTIALDTHTLLVGAMCIIVGLQAISFALIGRQFSTRYGFIPASESWGRALDSLTLERIALVAILLTALGLLGFVWALVLWGATGFGDLYFPAVTRITILSMTAIVGGVQLLMSGFFFSMMQIPLYERRVPGSPHRRDGES
jgi:glycosyltransferase involved in cell wall biosynthesis